MKKKIHKIECLLLCLLICCASSAFAATEMDDFQSVKNVLIPKNSMTT